MDSLVLDDNPSQATVPFIMYIVQGLHLAASFLAHDTFCLDSATKVHILYSQNGFDCRKVAIA